jgi:F-type H+-transporting ATPase subunit a
MKLITKIFLIITAALIPAAASENLGEFIFHHIGNSDVWHPILPYITIPLPAHFEVFGINMGITLHVLMIFITGIIMITLLSLAGKRKNMTPRSRFGHAIEAVVIYIRDELVIPNIGKKDAPKWLPFFLTLFFFLLTMNLLGLFPGMATATANINLTAAMAVMTFLCFNIAGMVKNGPFHYWVNLVPKGIPIPILIILAPIEILGLGTKAFALAIRLFANMTAGHVVIFALLGLISIFKSLWIVSIPGSIFFALFISIIEILVAFLQAYVFTLLATLFVGMAIHQDH